VHKNLPPPPAGFRPAGTIARAVLSDTAPEFARRKRVTGRRAQGVKYEKAAQAMLQERLGANYLPSPWIHFENAGELRAHWCQPDGLYFDEQNSHIMIVEMKYQHTSDAWHQVERLYRPVVEFLFPRQRISRLEVVKWFDPETTFPEEVRLVEAPERFMSDVFGVHIWKP
jgi:hypothetical protein